MWKPSPPPPRAVRGPWADPTPLGPVTFILRAPS
jgi:hypothetical protein